MVVKKGAVILAVTMIVNEDVEHSADADAAYENEGAQVILDDDKHHAP